MKPFVLSLCALILSSGCFSRTPALAEPAILLPSKTEIDLPVPEGDAAAALEKAILDAPPGKALRFRLAAGVWRFQRPLTLSPSLLVGRELELRGSGNGATRLSGSVEIVSASPAAGIWTLTAPISTVAPWSIFRQGRRLAPARHPDTGWLRLQATAPDQRSGFAVNSPELPPAGDLDGLMVDFLHLDASSLVPVASLNRDNCQIRFAAPLGDRAPERRMSASEARPRFAWYGAWALANQPGEWAQRRDGQLWLRQEGKPAPIEVPVSRSLIQIKGAPGKLLSGIVLENLIFEETACPETPGGLHPGTAAFFEPRDADGAYPALAPSESPRRAACLPAALRFEYSRDCRIDNCLFRNLGGTGIEIADGSRSIVLRRCRISGTGGNGINLGLRSALADQKTPFTESQPLPQDCRIDNCLIEDSGLLLHGASAVWIGYARRCSLSHCEIRKSPWSGLSIGGANSSRFMNAGGHLINDCDIHQVMTLLGDGGACVTRGNQELHDGSPTIFLRNTAHDLRSYSAAGPAQAWLCDSGSSGIAIRDGAAWNLDAPPLRFRRAADVRVDGMVLQCQQKYCGARMDGLFLEQRCEPGAVRIGLLPSPPQSWPGKAAEWPEESGLRYTGLRQKFRD